MKDRAGLFYAMLGDLFSFKNFSSTFGFFIACFSRDCDDLGQWRAYADDGRGFAIGLSPHLFGIENKIGQKPTQNVFVSPVFYDDAITKRRHARPIKEALSIFLMAANYAHHRLKDKRVGIPFLNQLAKAVIASPGKNAAKHVQQIGFPEGVNVWLDFEGAKKAAANRGGLFATRAGQAHSPAVPATGLQALVSPAFARDR